MRSLSCVLGTVAVTALATPWLASPPAAGQDDDLLAEGRELYQLGCSSCHGADGDGAVDDDGDLRGPSLRESGEAGAYYYLATGRMPLSNSEKQPRRKDPAYTSDQIEALVAYVDSLGEGPSLPSVELEGADVAEGGELYRASCQACHSASGAGGALSYGRAAPPLGPASQLEIAAAVRTGPGQMPPFGPELVTPEDLEDIVAYVEYLDAPEDPGGLPLGRTGPIPEGFVAWGVGMLALVGMVAWIGTRAPIRRRHP